MNKQWFEPGADGEIPFVKAALKTPVEMPVWETIAAAFRALLAEDAAQHDERDALIAQLRGEVERLTAERDALQARINGGVRVCRFPSMKKSWSENIGSFPESCERGILIIDPQPLDHIADAGKMVDERTTPGTRADRRQA